MHRSYNNVIHLWHSHLLFVCQKQLNTILANWQAETIAEVQQEIRYFKRAQCVFLSKWPLSRFISSRAVILEPGVVIK